VKVTERVSDATSAHQRERRDGGSSVRRDHSHGAMNNTLAMHPPVNAGAASIRRDTGRYDGPGSST
jgi:hypothetical protein